MKKILVTGGLGFVGAHLINSLVEKGNEVTCLSRTQGETKAQNSIILDLVKDKVSVSKNFDIIIHLASFIDVREMIKNPKEHTINNVNSTKNILEDIRINNPDCLFIFASSEKVYGNPTIEEVKETDATIPTDPYGESKLMCEELIQKYHSDHKLNYIMARIGNIFGPKQYPILFIPSMMTQLAGGKEELVMGSLDAYRNFIFIEDVVDFFSRCIENEKSLNQTYNISAYNLQISEVLDKILNIYEKKTGKKVKMRQDESLFRTSEKKATRYTLNCDKAKEVLGWEPKLSFDEALEKTFESYLK